jgi:hypothetical protein
MTADVKTAIAQMSYVEIVHYMKETSIEAPMPVYTALTQRLYEIALFDHHVPYEHRKDAWELLDTVKAFFEEGLKHLPNVVAQYRDANWEMEEGAHRIGIGSLAWLIEENGISDTEELVRFIARPEHAHLLEVFYSTLPSDTAALLKQEMARFTGS